MDKQHKEQRSRLQKLVRKWVRPLGFGWWRIDFHYSGERHPENPGVAGETHADWKYSHATITYYTPVIANMSDEELEHTFVHELCHLPMSGLKIEDSEAGYAVFERIVDDYAKHIIWAKDIK